MVNNALPENAFWCSEHQAYWKRLRKEAKYNGYKNVLSPAHDELDLKQADAITKYFSNNRVDL